MSLTWKDAVATVLTAAVAFVAYAKLNGWNLPLLGSWRLATLAVFALGIGTCIVAGSGSVPENNQWTLAATVLGVTSMLLLVAGLIFDSRAIFLLITADIIALWALTTIHHVIS